MDRPACECHGEPMRWNKDRRLVAGGYWRCSVVNREVRRRYYRAHKEEERESSRRWRAANPEKKAWGNATRLFAGRIYLGMVGFTTEEREAMLRGSSE